MERWLLKELLLAREGKYFINYNKNFDSLLFLLLQKRRQFFVVEELTLRRTIGLRAGYIPG